MVATTPAQAQNVWLEENNLPMDGSRCVPPLGVSRASTVTDRHPGASRCPKTTLGPPSATANATRQSERRLNLAVGTATRPKRFRVKAQGLPALQTQQDIGLVKLKITSGKATGYEKKLVCVSFSE